MSAAVPFDPYVLDTLMRDLVGHDRRPAAFLVYLAVAAAAGRGTGHASHALFAERTGLSKRGVQDALRHLAARGLVRVKRRGPNEPGTLTALTPWRRAQAEGNPPATSAPPVYRGSPVTSRRQKAGAA